jgi:methionine-R-sulfoxide reductase
MQKCEIKILILAAISGVALVSASAAALSQTKTSDVVKTEAIKMNKEFSTDHLTDLQKRVTLKGGTEPPFKNEYWDNKAEGIYVDIIDGTPLFSSTTKYESGTGWPSFTAPINQDAVTEHEDNGLFMKRTEIKSASTDSHLGHVFNDGPKDQGGLRYCMNSAALKFVPKADLESEGYGDYIKLFN